MQTPAPKGGFSPQDILFVLFKHKWKIIILTAFGLIAAAVVWKKQKPVYQSQAKLLVRYVVERSTVDTYEHESSGGGRTSGGVISAEVDILRSGDLAASAAQKIESTKPGSETPSVASVNKLASRISGGFTVASKKESKVLQLTYSDESPAMATTVLRELIQQYFEKHLEIHRSTGAFDLVTKQVDQARSRLKQTEDELNKVKSAAGIISLNDTVTSLESQRGRTREEVMNAEAKWIEQRALVDALRANAGEPPTSDAPKKPDAAPTEEQKPVSQRGLPVAEYKALATRLSFLAQRRNELLAKYTRSNLLIISMEKQISDAESERSALLEKHPELIAVSTASEKDPNQPNSPDLGSAEATLAAYAAKLDNLKIRLSKIDQEVERISGIGAQILSLEQQKQSEERKYQYLESSLDKAKTDEALDPSKIPNISIVQQPSPPIRTTSDDTKKIALALAGSGLGLGLTLAFLFEFVIDRRVKRSVEIENRLQLPLLLSIPYIRGGHRSGLPLHGDESDDHRSIPNGQSLHGENFVDPYSEAIRDRIIFNFGINNIIHRPKIIGLTSLVEGAGTSTIAAGLAKAFSRIKGSKILLVDLNADSIEANPLFGEIKPLSIVGALQKSRDSGFRDGNENLVVASAVMKGGTEGFAPTHLQQLMPYFERSDYDYVIFDLPKLDRISPTLSMAGLLDKILLVLDADNTNRDSLKWGFAQLSKGKADVSCIFNKARSHAPRWVEGEVGA